MASFGSRSRARLAECHPALQKVMHKAIENYDFAVLCGHRTEEDQTKAYGEHRSKVQWPNSKHNQTPSLAVDIAPWINGSIPWTDHRHFYLMAGRILQAADDLGITLRHGGDWDMDGDISDQSFNDLPHFELI